jgi:hypothetical protein
MDIINYSLLTKNIIPHVIAQVVGWENPDPTTKIATTKGHYTHCHLDIGPALRG